MKLSIGLLILFPFWYALIEYQSSLVKPWLVLWRGGAESNYTWRDRASAGSKFVKRNRAISGFLYREVRWVDETSDWLTANLVTVISTLNKNWKENAQIILSEFAKTCPLGFRLDSGEAWIQVKPATLNPRGTPSRLGWAHVPMTGLSAGGLLGTNCQKQGGG